MSDQLERQSRMRLQWYKLRDSMRDREVRRVIPLATVLTVITVLLALFTVQSRAPQSVEPFTLPKAPVSPAPPFQYVMQTDPRNERMLDLFTVQNGSLVRIATYPLIGEDLPGADRDILRQGLALRDSTELQSALEDYHSHLQVS